MVQTTGHGLAKRVDRDAEHRGGQEHRADGDTRISTELRHDQRTHCSRQAYTSRVVTSSLVLSDCDALGLRQGNEEGQTAAH